MNPDTEKFNEVLADSRTDQAIEREEWQQECARRSAAANSEAKRQYWLQRAYQVRLVK